MKRELAWLLLVWLVLAAVLFSFSRPDLDRPGLYYDEAVYGHFAKDFFEPCAAEPHMPGSQSVTLFGRPFPLFIQGYLGALKCWMLLPFFAVFGASAAVMRTVMLFWTLIGVLFFMLWVRKLLGFRAAAIAGFLLGLDPSFLFFSVWEWGAVVPSFFCRFAGFLFVLLWWRNRRLLWICAAGFVFGLGYFNKIDFAVILMGTGAAVFLTFRKGIGRAVRESARQIVASIAGFCLGAAPAIWYLPRTIKYVLSGDAGEVQETKQKLQALWTMFGGSYTWRHIARGGDPLGVSDLLLVLFSPFGFVFLLALAFILFRIKRERSSPGALLAGSAATVSSPSYCFSPPSCKLLRFFALSTILIFLLTALLPGATRLHHWTLVYPFPHLLVLSGALCLFANPCGKIPKCVGIAAITVMLIGHTIGLVKTRQLVDRTGGRGLWSASLDSFAAEVKNRTDLDLISMDWGFQEQLAFLTHGPRILDPVWQM